jgi:hypothetical protein
MPAVHSAYGIGMNWEGQVLMHAAFLPEDSLGVGIVALERFDDFDLTEAATARRIPSFMPLPRAPLFHRAAL